ncbi:hypothetical protein vBEfaSAL2_17 [Enterococcus phage vB_EfaS_AL2]|jgi:hypothetical protein|uniref:Uncharacterized protein n=1 Tax=Enterococcus phage vB_EfaS_AL2 TaxID=2175688 RepID=A0A2S1PFC2_9CAUD|nr:hypothetical protein FDJ52_gp17 [Enterococcus phage vB_EfaS_AL2]AWH15255.1 hypothetical protein vBEfaSAL2_17 [Enterococcus phage vB_EfaS_AL2]AWY03181.1 hypothetical protein [Enterococcus phage LY0323]
MKKLKNWRKNKMNKNLEVLTALLVGGLVAIFTVVFTGSDDVVVPTLASTFSLVFLILMFSDNKEDK